MTTLIRVVKNSKPLIFGILPSFSEAVTFPHFLVDMPIRNLRKHFSGDISYTYYEARRPISLPVHPATRTNDRPRSSAFRKTFSYAENFGIQPNFEPMTHFQNKNKRLAVRNIVHAKSEEDDGNFKCQMVFLLYYFFFFFFLPTEVYKCNFFLHTLKRAE